VGGRPKALDEADLKKARALLRSGEYSEVQVADELEVSRHTLWRAPSLEKTKRSDKPCNTAGAGTTTLRGTMNLYTARLIGRDRPMRILR
jgi:hypothetical protein